MKNNIILNKIISKIKTGEEISPVLFSGKNPELLNQQVKNIALSLFSEFDVPNINLFTLNDDWETIKILEIKKFLELANTTTPYAFQIFFIENISRMTLPATNSCLKFFEEPGKKNIIFLTNSWEAGVLDTILSRVQFVDLWWASVESKDEFFYSMIDSYIKGWVDLISYFFRNKLEKAEYIRFLNTIILYSKDNLHSCHSVLDTESLGELEYDINAVAKNNVNSRWVIDKWILKLSRN